MVTSTYTRYICIGLILLALAVLTACAPSAPAYESPEAAILAFQQACGLPESEVRFIEDTRMVNSPTSDLTTKHYQDAEGRSYYLASDTFQVLEMDARVMMASLPWEPEVIPQPELEALAYNCVNAQVAQFPDRVDDLSYEAGAKNDNYFFGWYAPVESGLFNGRFAQVGVHDSGLLFAVHNTRDVQD